MKDLNLKVTVRNARLLDAIERTYGSQAAMARNVDISYGTLNDFVGMRESPVNCTTGKWKQAALDIAYSLGKEPEELWPEHLRELKAKKSTTTISLDAAELAAIGEMEKTVMQRRMIAEWSKTLTPRERKVLMMRVDGATLGEAGKDENVSRERLRQIEHKAMRKMRKQVFLTRTKFEDVI